MSKYITGIFAVPKYESKNITNLPFCSKDCEELKNVLCQNIGVEENHLKIFGENSEDEVNKYNIIKNVELICNKAEQDDIVILYFSGHGYSENNEGYLITYDTKYDLISDTAVPISRIKKELDKCDARNRIFIIDSCYSGMGRGKSANRGMTEEFEASLFSNMSEGLIIFASCKRNEESFSLKDGSMSVFTHFLVEGLKGNVGVNDKSEISFNDLEKYVSKNVIQWAFTNGLSQTPNKIIEYTGELMLPIKNPEVSEVKTHKSDISKMEYEIIQMKLVSTYFADTTQMEIDDDGDPTGNYVTVPDEVRRSRVINNETEFKGKLFATIAKYYKTSDIKLKEDGVYDFPIGQFSNMSKGLFHNEFVLTINKELDAEIVKKNLLLDLDEQTIFKWGTIEYAFNGLFDFDTLQNIAIEKNFQMIELQLEKDYSLIKMSTKEKNAVQRHRFQRQLYISFKNESNMGKMIIDSDYLLEREFFETMPIKDMINAFSKSLRNNMIN